ncbi:MAG: DUF438 domain-containing protein [Proteobacteria bacterium]|nr:DUF438 domain-containing protein [Pseudomonadota bacterium]
MEKLQKKEILKEIIKLLHQGDSIEELKSKFKSLLSHVTSTEITQLEEELIKEGLSREDIRKLCNLHIELFKESLENETVIAPPGHPIHILMEEHRIFLNMARDLLNSITCYLDGRMFEHLNKVRRLIDDLKNTENHYLREENVLFPYLEKYGITEPPKMMWSEHDSIRAIKKEIFECLDKDKFDALKDACFRLVEMLSTHFYKENNILFPAGIRNINELEWVKVRKEFDDIGYSFVQPPAFSGVAIIEEKVIQYGEEHVVHFDTGNLYFDEIEAIFNTLPVDITFVDRDDKVCYFSKTRDRIFLRTPAIIGRKVQQCHPEKSFHLVNRILSEFKEGKRERAQFWITLNGRFILIQYFAVRNKKGTYLGCLEVTQDITEIKKLEGEKRLLDE